MRKIGEDSACSTKKDGDAEFLGETRSVRKLRSWSKNQRGGGKRMENTRLLKFSKKAYSTTDRTQRMIEPIPAKLTQILV